jgi:hypothetical protein
MGGQLREVPPVKKDLPGGGPEHRTDQVEECCLSGAVRADQAADLSGFDLEAHILDGGQAAEALGDADNVEKRAHDSHRLRRL